MSTYYVAIAIDNAPYRLDLYVEATDEDDAVSRAMSKVPATDKVQKVITVEKKD